MRGSIRMGLGIAAVFAVGVLVIRVFGGHSESYFVRAAQESAVRCLTGRAPCLRLDSAAVRKEPAPLTAASACAKPNAWKEVRAVSNGQSRIVVTCNDRGKAYLYHMGRLARAEAGNEQWVVCSAPGCEAEENLFAR